MRQREKKINVGVVQCGEKEMALTIRMSEKSFGFGNQLVSKHLSVTVAQMVVTDVIQEFPFLCDLNKNDEKVRE